MFARFVQIASVAALVLGPVLGRACTDCACGEATPVTNPGVCPCCQAESVAGARAHGDVSCCSTGVDCPACWWCVARGAHGPTIEPPARPPVVVWGHAPLVEVPAEARAEHVRLPCDSPEDGGMDHWGSALPLLI